MQAKELPSLEERMAKFEARKRRRNEISKACQARVRANKEKYQLQQEKKRIANKRYREHLKQIKQENNGSIPTDEEKRKAYLEKRKIFNKTYRDKVKAAKQSTIEPPVEKPEEQFIPCKGLAYMNIDRDRLESPPRMTLGEAARFLDIDPSKLLLDSLNGIAPQPMPDRNTLTVVYLKSDIEKYKEKML